MHKWINDFYKVANLVMQNQKQIENFNNCTDFFWTKPMILKLNYLQRVSFNNEGIYILKNSNITKQFLKAIIKYAPLFYDYTDELCTETQTVNMIMRKEQFIPHIKVMPEKTQGHIYGNRNKYNEDECLICHNSTMNKNSLYDFLMKIANNKYWKQYNFI